MKGKRWSMASVGVLSMVLCLSGWASAGSLEPPGPPGPTMYTLAEIYEKLEASK